MKFKLTTRSVIASLAIATGVTVTTGALAYTLTGAKWGTSTVAYYVNPTNLDLPTTSVIAAIRAGAEAWQTQSNANIRLEYAGITNGTTVANNGKNEIMFRNATADSGTSTIATTYWWYSSGRTTDSDMVFWDGQHRFFAGTTGCSSGFYIEDIAAHEFGHFLGINHSSVSGATMYPSVTGCSTAPRSLASDDVSAIQALYPAMSTPTPTPVPSPSPTATPTPTPAPSPSPSPSPSATPAPSPAPSATPLPSPTPIALPAMPSSPIPANGSTWRSIYSDLDWASASRATSYRVYFGTTSTPPYYTTVTSSYRSLPTLRSKTRYYWRIEAVNSSGTTKGPLWYFTTR